MEITVSGVAFLMFILPEIVLEIIHVLFMVLVGFGEISMFDNCEFIGLRLSMGKID